MVNCGTCPGSLMMLLTEGRVPIEPVDQSELEVSLSDGVTTVLTVKIDGRP